MRILQVVHGFPPSGVGGAELYAEALVHGLVDAGHEVAVFTRDAVPGRPDFETRDEVRSGVRIQWINNTFGWARSFVDTYASSRIDEQFTRFLHGFSPDVAHVHHLTCLSTGVLEALGAAGIPTLLHLHDYWMLCHRGQLLDTSCRRCDGPGATGCPRCTGVAGAVPGTVFRAAPLLRPLRDTLPSWVTRRADAALSASEAGQAAARLQSRRRLEHMRQRFARVALAIAPSEHTRDRFIGAGFPSETIAVSEYGVRASVHVARAAARQPLRAGFLGTLMASKAPHLLKEAVEQLPPGSIEAVIFGAPAAYHGDTSYSNQVVLQLRHPAVSIRGPLPHRQVPAALASLDVLVFPSIWEETSGIGAREALAAGVPVVASRIGGIPEFVRDDVNGLLFTPGDAGDLARQLGRLVEDPELLPRLRRGITPVRSFDDDLRETIGRYQSIAARPAMSQRKAKRIAAVVLNFRTPLETANAVAWLELVDPPLSSILVVDNGDGVALRAALAPSRATVLASGDNLGFAAGCNLGIRTALAEGADAVFLVNSDVAVPPSALRHLVESLERGAAITGPVVRDRARPEIVQSAGIDVHQRSGRMRNRTWFPSEADGNPYAVSGCAMLVDRRVFELIGLLPESYFFGFEDIAFCHTAAMAGLAVRLCPAASVLHAGSATMGKSPDRLYYGARNHLRLSRALPAASPLHAAARSVAIVAYSALHALKADGGSLGSRLQAVGHGVVDFTRGHEGPRRSPGDSR